MSIPRHFSRGLKVSLDSDNTPLPNPNMTKSEELDIKLRQDFPDMYMNLVEPSDEFLQRLAEIERAKGIELKVVNPLVELTDAYEYTLGKTSEDRFYSDGGAPLYPTNNGGVGVPETITLLPGTMLYDRHGTEEGRYLGVFGTSIEKRSLPRGSVDRPYHVYKVIAPIPDTKKSITAPWFGQPGGAEQFYLPDKVKLLNKYLERVDIENVDRERHEHQRAEDRTR